MNQMKKYILQGISKSTQINNLILQLLFQPLVSVLVTQRIFDSGEFSGKTAFKR